VYTDTTSEWTAFDHGSLDLDDWALDQAHITEWSVANGPMVVNNYGGENGFYILDINNCPTYGTGSDPSTWTHNPTSELPLREAIGCCVNRSYIVAFTGGLALPMYTPICNYMGGYINPNIVPGGSLGYLTWGGYTGNLTLAAAILDAAGFTVDPVTHVRIDPATGKDLTPLIFYSRTGDRGTAGDEINLNLNAVGIPTAYTSSVPRSTVTGPVFAQHYFNLYTGGWISVGPDPDYVCDLYNGSNYYYPGSPPNYDDINYPNVNGNATIVKLAPDLATGTAATLAFEVAFAQEAAAIPMWSYTGYKNYKVESAYVSSGTGSVTTPDNGTWVDLLNAIGFGEDSWFSTLDMQTYGTLYPNTYAYYGFSSTVTLQNQVYAQWFWDEEVLGRIYDSGWGRDPYTLLWDVPQLYENYTIGSWTDPVTGATKTSVTITLRPDVYWQDGYPVTIGDVFYTLAEISNDLLAKGFPPPWWYTAVQYIQSVEILDDYHVEVLLAVQSAWAAGWVIGSAIMPEHIWKPIVDESISPSNNPVVQGTTPDPNIIGTGPYRYVSGLGATVGDEIVLTANTPGSVVHGITSPGYYLYNPVMVTVNTPSYAVRILAVGYVSTTVPVIITLRDLWLGGSLTVNKYVYESASLGTLGTPSTLLAGYPENLNLAPVSPYPAGTSNVETISVTETAPALVYIKVAVHIKGPSPLTYSEPWGSTTETYTVANPWISTWINVTLPIWITTKEDIGGTNLYDVMGYSLTLLPVALQNTLKGLVPSPDLSVDGKDISTAAKAFGTIPGDPRWNSAADVNHDYTVDGKDISIIAKQFGYG